MVIDPATRRARAPTRGCGTRPSRGSSPSRATGRPVPTPVWFWWDGETILVYSQRDKPKLRHIVANPRVAIALRA